MSDHTATVHWQRQADEAFTDNRYHRAHDWRFDGGAVVRGSSAPSSVPLPHSDPAAVDPEEAFVAALSSCHMLWFLHLAAAEGHVVDAYHDQASGHMSRIAPGKVGFTSVTLRPAVRFAGTPPDAQAHAALHHRAHEACFIANSVSCPVHCEPSLES